MTLRDEIKGMWATFREDVDTADQVADRILSLIAEDRRALVEALRRYGRHEPGCNLMCAVSEYDNGTCTCGLDAALASAGEPPKEEG
ncbi:MAG: hypothetical protein PHO67_08200 [Candidatus Omnitrophica bacterium]|nr:hypothetical protein [Candidatus Omnitrophota bacterium]